ncbi:MAG: primase-helicase zinc-binding domain-containing protein [Planctomycetaceae bacterium]
MKTTAHDVKRLASGRWVQILEAMGGLTSLQLNPSVHGPCPKCGGTDRFRALDDVAETGGLFCNQCHNGDSSPKSGDGLAAIQWLCECSFPDALKRVAEFTGSNQVNGSRTSQKPPVTPNRIDENYLKFLRTGF